MAKWRRCRCCCGASWPRSGLPPRIVAPIRIPRSKLVREDELRRVVRLAALRTVPGDAILVLFDAGEECAATLGPRVAGWALAERCDRRVAVVLAVCEFEAWFLAAAGSLVAGGRLEAGATPPANPEGTRDAKGWLSQRMGRRYSPAIDQPSFAASFDLGAARAAPSFRKLERDVRRLLQHG